MLQTRSWLPRTEGSVGLAFAHQGQHFAAQVERDLRVGIGKRLVLAHHAAQFGDERVEARFLGRVAELQRRDVGADLRVRDRRDERRGQREQQGEQHGAHYGTTPACCGSIASSAGSSSPAINASVSGPTCFQRITPFASTRKVSGAP